MTGGNIKIRYVLAIMGFFNFTVLNMLRVCTSVALVAMVDWKNIPGEPDNSTCVYPKNVTRSSLEDGPFKWGTDIQGHILAGYFYGLMATQYLGGSLAQKVSAKYILLIGTLMSAMGTLLIPFTASPYGHSVILLQLLKGLGQGFIIPSFSVLIGKWIPISERYITMCIIGSGIPLGGFFGFSISGVICKAESLGWKYVFFIFAGIAFIWCFLWTVLIYESPLTHPYITNEEMLRIMKSQIIVPVKDKVPYKYIFKSGPVWAFVAVGFACFWALSLYTTVIPIFMSTVLKFDIEMNGVLSSLPFLFEMVIFILSCRTNDKLKKKFKNPTVIHKISITIGLIGFALCTIGVTFTACNRLYTVCCLILGLAFCGACFSQTSVIPLEMTPRYAGSVSLMMNTSGALSGIILPTLMGYLTLKNWSVTEWNILFYVSAAIALLAVLFFLCLGSSKIQEWDKPESIQPQESSQENLVFTIDMTQDGVQKIRLDPVQTSGNKDTVEFQKDVIAGLSDRRQSPVEKFEPKLEKTQDNKDSKLSHDRPWRTSSFEKLPHKPEPKIIIDDF